MKFLEDFRERSLNHDICENYLYKWDSCHTTKDLFDMSLEIQAMMFIVKSTSEGWGLKSSELTCLFHKFINGRYIGEIVNSDEHEYTSSMWVGYNGTIMANETIMALINCKGVVHAPRNASCMLFVDKDSECEIVVDENATVVVESFSRKVTTQEDRTKVRIKYL